MATLAIALEDESSIQVEHYQLFLQPDLGNKSISGKLTLLLPSSSKSTESNLLLSIGNLEIDSVTLSTPTESSLEYTMGDNKLAISLPADGDEDLQLTINYHGSPSFGLQFSDDGQEVSTAFSTEQWMPVQNSPAQRASFSLDLLVPPEFTVVATGTHVSSEELGDNLILHRWRETEPMPAYLFGFSAGKFRVVEDQSSEPQLRFFGPPDFTERELRTIFADTRDAISYFEQRSGIDYPDEDYVQVLLRRGYGQELNGISVMRETYGRSVLDDSDAIWLAIHELAHQWWGNRVTNVDWTHFWLNEGLASFMTAAYFEQRFGRAAYDELINNSRETYERLLADGHDKPLVFPNWNSPTREDRSLVYDKGAYFIHLVREQLGEDNFWKGIQLYTERHWQDSVTSEDFQQAMEEAGGVDLGEFFRQWVY